MIAHRILPHKLKVRCSTENRDKDDRNLKKISPQKTLFLKILLYYIKHDILYDSRTKEVLEACSHNLLALVHHDGLQN